MHFNFRKKIKTTHRIFILMSSSRRRGFVHFNHHKHHCLSHHSSQDEILIMFKVFVSWWHLVIGNPFDVDFIILRSTNKKNCSAILRDFVFKVVQGSVKYLILRKQGKLEGKKHSGGGGFPSRWPITRGRSTNWASQALFVCYNCNR